MNDLECRNDCNSAKEVFPLKCVGHRWLENGKSGFSVNCDILVENMLESTVFAQRLVYEGIERAGGVTKVEVTPEMVAKVKAAHRTMEAAKKDADKETSEAQKKRIEKRKLQLSLNNVAAAKKNALENMQAKIESYDAEISSIRSQLK